MHARVPESKRLATAKVLDNTGNPIEAAGLLCQGGYVFKSWREHLADAKAN